MIIDLLITIFVPFLALIGGVLSTITMVIPKGLTDGLALMLGNLKYAVPFFPVADLVSALTVVVTFEGLVVGYLVVRFFINLLPTKSNM